MKLTRNPYPYYCLPALFVSSCGMFPSLPEDLPPELEAVLSDKATFDLEPSDPLGDVEVGTVVDNLQGLDGCWGFYERDDLRPNPPLSEFITVHVFDNANGTYTRWQLFTTSGLFGMLNGFRGTFVIVGDNRVRLTLDEGYRTQDDDGNPLDEPSFVERQTPLNQEWELLPRSRNIEHFYPAA